MTVKFKGWAAIPVIVLVVLFVGWRMGSARSALEGKAREQIVFHLLGEYNSAALPDLEAAVALEHQAGLAAQAAKVVGPKDIEISTIGVKGTGKKVVAKIGVTVAGGPPPDGKPTRYFELRHDMISGWRVRREVSALSYYLKLF